MHTRRYDDYIARHEDDDIYQEEIEVARISWYLMG
jgi:hypothetical protein